jgi:YD repeat-containing protein
MKLNYHADTDSLYIDLSDRPGVETREVSEGVALDYDADGNLVGIDIDNASKKVEMNRLVLNKLPATMETVAA